MKKIAFCGSHGVGKSAACLYLAAHLKRTNPSNSVKVLDENVREIHRLVDNKINTKNFQRLCLVDLLRTEFINEMLYDILVCDRTAIDTLVYGLFYKIDFPKEYLNLALQHLNTYDIIFFVRPNLKDSFISSDGFRDTNKEVRDLIDKEFESILKNNNIKYKEIKTDDVFNLNFINYL